MMVTEAGTSGSQLLERRQSYDRIPRFFFPKAETAENAVAPQTSRAVCRRLALARIDELMLSRSELDQLTQAVCRYAHAPKVPRLLTILMDKTATPSSVVCVDRLLRDHKTVLLSYDDWNEVVQSVRSEKLSLMMTAQVFLMLPPDDDGRVNGLALLEYLHHLHRTLTATRFLLAQPDATVEGVLSESDLTKIIQRRISDTIRDSELISVDTEFASYYELIATRLIVLRHDVVAARGHVSIDALVACPVFQEWIQLTDRDLHALFTHDSNRFSPEAIRQIHRQYVQLDRDKNGLLSVDEMMDYGKKKAFNPIALTPTHDLTRAFVTQVFHETATFPPDNEMDYRAFVDLTLRMADRTSVSSLRFFWSVLDIHKQGYLDAFTLDFFLRDLVTHAREEDIFPAEEAPSATVNRLRTQVFDLVAPRDPLRITWRDLAHCKLGHLVVRMITDTVAYRAYDACEGKFVVS